MNSWSSSIDWIVCDPLVLNFSRRIYKNTWDRVFVCVCIRAVKLLHTHGQGGTGHMHATVRDGLCSRAIVARQAGRPPIQVIVLAAVA
jgi:hypothetical protein